MDDLKDDYIEWKKGQAQKKNEYALCDQIYIKFREYLGRGEMGGQGWGREVTKW